MKKHFFFAIILCSFIVQAQDRASQRPAYRLEIAADEQHQYGMDIPASPYFVAPNTLQLFCNEKVWVECEIEGNAIQSMKVVEQNNHPTRTIEIELTQEASDRTRIQTILVVKNPFDQKLKYKAMMFTPTHQDWAKTSILPVEPKLLGYEMWPHAIVTLVLDNWKLK
ncbi:MULTISPECIES: hypothetical protein [unclassified Myroides]|uniref:hypothetical protein n=1 Tax=unclassified Myroides TaxID=2642485 RepID=UPI003D2F8D18